MACLILYIFHIQCITERGRSKRYLTSEGVITGVCAIKLTQSTVAHTSPINISCSEIHGENGVGDRKNKYTERYCQHDLEATQRIHMLQDFVDVVEFYFFLHCFVVLVVEYWLFFVVVILCCVVLIVWLIILL